ncbi:MAG: DMT family transporter [Chloroflexi bacterium]|nr:DMT family transporter [Chloroflexota bacterium]
MQNGSERPSGGQDRTTSRAVIYTWLAVGVASVSLGPITIKLADAEPLSVAALRMLFGTLLVAIPTLLKARGELTALSRRDLGVLAISGLFLAGHFAFWVTSLDLTSVASSVLLVTTTPVFVAIASRIWLREHVGKLTVAAILLSMAGGAVLSFGDWDGDGRRLLGDSLALLGAVSVGGYMLVGRGVRHRMSNLPYVTVVYAVAAAVLLIGAVASGQSLLGLSAEAYFWIGMSALVPQAIGHSLLNWSLAHVSATNVTMAVRVEPVVATLLAIPVLGEVPAWTVVPGGALVMLGVYLAIRSDSARES